MSAATKAARGSYTPGPSGLERRPACRCGHAAAAHIVHDVKPVFADCILLDVPFAGTILCNCKRYRSAVDA